MPFEKVCGQCESPFTSPKRTAKFCSCSCAALSRVPITVERNKARRKHDHIEGLTKQQSCYRGNRGRDRLRDTQQRHDLIRLLGGECVACGYNANILGLVLDHVRGDGAADRKRIGNKIARYYTKNLNEAKENLQVLCATCNQIKSHSNSEHNRSRRVVFNPMTLEEWTK